MLNLNTFRFTHAQAAIPQQRTAPSIHFAANTNRVLFGEDPKETWDPNTDADYQEWLRNNSDEKIERDLQDLEIYKFSSRAIDLLAKLKHWRAEVNEAKKEDEE